MKKIINRAKAPTPKFFKVLRTVGLALATVGAVVSFTISLLLKSLNKKYKK